MSFANRRLASMSIGVVLAAFACWSMPLIGAQPPSQPKDKPAAASATQPASKDADKGKKAAAADAKKEEKSFSVEGYYCEACSCHPPCPCELTGAMGGCKGVGVYHFASGTYDGQDFSGVSVAYGLHLGEWVTLYIDAKDPKQRAAAEKFMRAALAGFGPVKSAKDAKIEFTGTDGKYKVAVDGGKVFTCETEPVLGGDKKTPISHTNTMDVLNPTMYQGKCVSCKFKDGDQSFSLDKGRNAYFNQHMKSSGKI